MRNRAKNPKILAIFGKTATGKSDLAVFLALKFNGEVISADSRQVYRGLNSGTGKITKLEMKGVAHYLLDISDPKKQFSVSEYKRLAEKAIEEIISRGKLPIICGGTGLYMDAVLKNIIVPEVPPNGKLRKKLDNKTTKQLFEILKKLDSRRAKEIDRNNPRRLVRAIEIATALGKVPILEAQPPKFDTLKIGLDLPDEKLKQNIHVRLLTRIKAGMVTEVKNLHKRGLSWKRMESFGLEYKYLALYLQNKITKKEMLDGIEKDTWQYSKRQATWFKRDKDTGWFKPGEKIKIVKEVEKFLKIDLSKRKK
jgi:tRNA dimethylallyltransferase